MNSTSNFYLTDSETISLLDKGKLIDLALDHTPIKSLKIEFRAFIATAYAGMRD